jgi:hypothetical protein
VNEEPFRARWVVAIVGGFLLFVVGIWVPPLIEGPTVECGLYDQATCDRVWPRVVVTLRIFAVLLLGMLLVRALIGKAEPSPG